MESSEFLKIFKESNPKNFTHYEYSTGKYLQLENHNISKYVLGLSEILKNNKSITDITLGERMRDEYPLFFDIFLRFENDSVEEKPYTDDFIINTISIIQDKIEQNLEITSFSEDELKCMILETGMLRCENEKDVCFHIRLFFPFCVCNPKSFDIIRKKFITEARKKKLLQLLNVSPIGDLDDIFITHEEKYYSFGCVPIYATESPEFINPIKLYDSSGRQLMYENKPLVSKYGVSKIISIEQKDYNIYEEYSDIFEVGNHKFFSRGLCDVSILYSENQDDIIADEAEKQLKTFLFLFFSLDYNCNKIVRQKQKDESVEPKKKQKEHLSYETDLSICEKMLALISPLTYSNECSWIEIGKCLYNSDTSFEKETGLKLWIDFSVRNIKQDVLEKFLSKEDGLNYQEKMKNVFMNFCDKNYLTFKTICWYAKRDDKSKYEKWYESWIAVAIDKVLSFYTDNNMAEFIYRLYYDRYIFDSSSKEGTWYRFLHIRWVKTSRGLDITNAMSKEVLSKFMHYKSMKLKAQQNDDDDERGSNKIKDCIGTIEKKLGTNSSKQAILRELYGKFRVDNLEDIMDSNIKIMANNNCVIEVYGNLIMTRLGKPEDYIHKSTGLHFKKYEPCSKDMKELLDWLRKVYPDEKLFDYFCKFASSIFIGKNQDKILVILTGTGNNSKSMIVKLFETAFGDYCVKLPVSFLYDDGKNSKPRPEIVQLKNTRIAFVDEPESNIKLKKNAIKAKVGGDSFFDRGLFSNGSKIQVSCKIVITTNDVPAFEDGDQASRERVSIIPHVTKWDHAHRVPSTPRRQMQKRLFPLDKFFEDKIKRLAPAFLSLLFDYFPHYCSEGLKKPECVEKITQEYWDNNDIYGIYLAENVIEKEGSKISATDMYENFKNWHRNSYPGIKIVDITKFKNSIYEKIGKPNFGAFWKGVGFIEEDELIEKKIVVPSDFVQKEEIQKEKIKKMLI